MKRTPLLLILGIIALVLVGVYTGFMFWKNSAAKADFKLVEKNLNDLNEQVMQFQDQQVVEAINAKKALPLLKEDSVLWSQVLKDIRRVIPSKGGDPIVEVLSYSGSAGSDLSINVKTVPGSDEPYMDVADLIEAFDDSDLFEETFVPSLSSGQDEEGREVLTFVLSTKYVEEDVLNFLKDDVSERELPAAYAPTKTSTATMEPITR